MRVMRTPTQRFNQRRGRVAAAVGTLALALGLACSLNSPSKTWKALDYAELEKAMESPTGVLSEVSPNELLDDIPPLVAALAQTIALFDRIRELAKPPAPDGGVTQRAPNRSACRSNRRDSQPNPTPQNNSIAPTPAP